MNLSQYIGMALLILCAIFLSLVNNPDTAVKILPENRSSSVIPVLLAIGSSFLFGLRSITNKYFVEQGYQAYNFTIQFLFIDGIIGTVGLLIQYGIYDKTITTEIFLYGFFAGIFAGIGIVMINYSMAIGIAGPASALSNLATVLQTLLDYFILGQELGVLQILGLCIGILGAIVLAIGTEVINIFTNLFKSKRKD